MKEHRNIWIALLVLAALTPAGFYLAHSLSGGSAWGEWGIDEVKRLIGYTPAGMEKEAGRWNAPLPGYERPGGERNPLARRSLSYLVSAIVGIATCVAGGYLLGRWLRRRR